MTAWSAVILASGSSSTIRPVPMAAPTIWAAMKPGAEAGAMPAKVSVNILPVVTAGLANEVELVNQ
jgi:hypothetical protein